MITQEIAIYGAGGFGREVAWLIETCNGIENKYKISCFIDDDKNLIGKIINEFPVMGLADANSLFPKAKVISGIGIPKPRQLTIERAYSIGFDTEIIVHPRVEMSRWVKMGKGTIICAGCILTTNIDIGQQVQINLDCTLGHDVVLGDYTTLSPGVHVSGYVHIGKRVFVGTGAVFINGTDNEPLVIGDDVVIGAGACVTKSIKEGIWGGVPARPLKK
jgi:sugar O-acyltransferase (sialic acid O-acetyltransferase NeuD family)